MARIVIILKYHKSWEFNRALCNLSYLDDLYLQSIVGKCTDAISFVTMDCAQNRKPGHK
jgi:hypothetical protein